MGLTVRVDHPRTDGDAGGLLDQWFLAVGVAELRWTVVGSRTPPISLSPSSPVSLSGCRPFTFRPNLICLTRARLNKRSSPRRTRSARTSPRTPRC